jgi:hypothetical protein
VHSVDRALSMLKHDRTIAYLSTVLLPTWRQELKTIEEHFMKFETEKEKDEWLMKQRDIAKCVTSRCYKTAQPPRSINKRGKRYLAQFNAKVNKLLANYAKGKRNTSR